MKKILLSLAVIAVSGAYVVAENQFGSQPSDGPAAAALSINPASAIKQPGSIDLGSLTTGAPIDTPNAPGITLGSADATPPSTSTSVRAMAAAAAPVLPAAPPVSRAPASDVAELTPATPAIAGNAATAPLAPAVPRARPLPAAQPAPIAQAAPAPAAQSQGQFVDGTYKGTSANAYYGRVQVQAVVQGGQLASINVLSYPNDRRTSRYINGQALPVLTREAVQAQSANVDAVSGATLTSNSYRQSLAAALRAAGGAATAAGGNNA